MTNNVLRSYNSPSSGSTLFSQWPSLQLSMTNNEFNCKNTAWTVAISSDLSLQKNSIGGSIYVKDATQTV